MRSIAAADDPDPERTLFATRRCLVFLSAACYRAAMNDRMLTLCWWRSFP